MSDLFEQSNPAKVLPANFRPQGCGSKPGALGLAGLLAPVPDLPRQPGASSLAAGWREAEARRRAIYTAARDAAGGDHLAGVKALLDAGEVSAAVARIAGLAP